MERTNKIRVLIQLHQDGELTGGMNQAWTNENLSRFLLALEGDAIINRPDKNFIKILISEKDFEKTIRNY